ncbi:MAG: ATP-dependent helicase, partial [Phycisphaerales bacterium]|nr:ATP-dependent helicase [Phycisphaerales bacterium]
MPDDTTTSPAITLSEAQRAAVEAKGPVMVLAGPGTGKTTVMVERLAHLASKGADPASMLAITFTRKAAEELRLRLGARLGNRADLVSTENFNSFGQRLVFAHADRLGYTSKPRLIDDTHLQYVVRHLIIDHDLFRGFLPRDRRELASELVSFIERMRHRGFGPDEARRRIEAHDEPGDVGFPNRDLLLEACDAFQVVEDHCRLKGWMTFDDQIVQATRLLREHDDVRHPYRHVIVDECQDVNPAQIELLRLLDVEDTCMVGDDDQAIYAFRGSDVRAFEHMHEAFPGASVLRLTENRRSARRIVEVSNAIIANANSRFDEGKVIEAHRQETGRVEIFQYEPHRLSDAVVALIRQDREANPDRPLGEYAVIGRNRSHLEDLVATLDLEGLRWQFSSGSGAPDVLADLEAWMGILT